VKTRSLIPIMIIIILLSLPVLGSNTRRFSLKTNYKYLIDSYGAVEMLTEIGGRYWLEDKLGVENHLGLYTLSAHGAPYPYYSVSFLIGILKTSDVQLYASGGIYAVDYSEYMESWGLGGGYHKGLGVEFAVADSLNLSLGINHYERNSSGPYSSGSLGTKSRDLFTGFGFIYYF